MKKLIKYPHLRRIKHLLPLGLENPRKEVVKRNPLNHQIIYKLRILAIKVLRLINKKKNGKYI